MSVSHVPSPAGLPVFPELNGLTEIPHFMVAEWTPAEWVRQGVFHVLVVLPEAPEDGGTGPGQETLNALRQRRAQSEVCASQKKKKGFDPHVAMLSDGVLVSWVWLAGASRNFERHTRLRQALQPLLEEKPTHLAVWFSGQESSSEREEILYTLTLNGRSLPSAQRAAWGGVKAWFLLGSPPPSRPFCASGFPGARQYLDAGLDGAPPESADSGKLSRIPSTVGTGRALGLGRIWGGTFADPGGRGISGGGTRQCRS